uniref:Uncharacterized protein n=1 Tax=Timema monikensis TaxID=170555 RepID=A0A7R9HK53_9NEOP|nr:unnamed protein product [Timema monikensis]
MLAVPVWSAGSIFLDAWAFPGNINSQNIAKIPTKHSIERERPRMGMLVNPGSEVGMEAKVQKYIGQPLPATIPETPPSSNNSSQRRMVTPPAPIASPEGLSQRSGHLWDLEDQMAWPVTNSVVHATSLDAIEKKSKPLPEKLQSQKGPSRSATVSVCE